MEGAGLLNTPDLASLWELYHWNGSNRLKLLVKVLFLFLFKGNSRSSRFTPRILSFHSPAVLSFDLGFGFRDGERTHYTWEPMFCLFSFFLFCFSFTRIDQFAWLEFVSLGRRAVLVLRCTNYRECL